VKIPTMKTKVDTKVKVRKVSLSPSKPKHTSTASIIPQSRPKASDTKIQCWAHSRSGTRCTASVTSREGEPIPIPYCDRHLKTGDGALKVVNHPTFGRADAADASRAVRKTEPFHSIPPILSRGGTSIQKSREGGH
jgi:hypothetical protein